MDYKEALKNLNNSKVVTILFYEELQTIAKELGKVDTLHEQINELSQKLNSMKEEINKSENLFRKQVAKAHDFDRLCNIIFEGKDSYIFDFICLNSIDKKENADDFYFVKNLIEEWRTEKEITNGK